jgi:hypothetical protein
MRISVHLAALAATLLSACAVPEPVMTADEQNALAPVECRGADQCGRMWQRAQLWLAKNAHYKIQTATDVVIQTYTPVSPSTSLGFTITKEPKGGDNFEIDSRISCANEFGCRHHPKKAKSTLHRYIRETPQ